MTPSPSKLRAGAARRDISPTTPMFLVGYPHVERTSIGVHDPIYASALYVANPTTAILTIAVDVCYVMVETSRACRDAISRATGIPVANIFISPTHTHSAPQTADILAWHEDPVVPLPDPAYMEFFSRSIVEAAVTAHATAVPARIVLTRTEAHGVGRNRHAPDGPTDHEVGLLYARRDDNHAPIGLMLIYGMHPTCSAETPRSPAAALGVIWVSFMSVRQLSRLQGECLRGTAKQASYVFIVGCSNSRFRCSIEVGALPYCRGDLLRCR